MLWRQVTAGFRRALHPFVPAELGRDFDLRTALAFGTLPVIWQAPVAHFLAALADDSLWP